MSQYKLKPKEGSTKKRRRVGRGNASGFGGEAGRGHKGQKSRSGGGTRPGFEGGRTPLYQRIPKLKGMNNLFRTDYDVVNLSYISERYEDSEVVNVETLKEKGFKFRYGRVKVLGNGELTKSSLTFNIHKVSKTAEEKISSAKGTLEIIS